MGILQGVLGNYKEYDIDSAKKEYGHYLMENEKIEIAFKLVRDAMIITDKRLILSDKQGLTGSKERIKSIFLSSIYAVTMETAGAGLDDSEITISYFLTPYLKARDPQYDNYKMEFPKKFNVRDLYIYFLELAHQNYVNLNK